MKKKVLIMFGGVSAEHEVSIITGLQVIENIDLEKYEPLPVYVDKKGEINLLLDLKKRKHFLSSKGKSISFGSDKKGGFVETTGLTGKKYYPDVAYLAFHGGSGEAGPIQGMLQTFRIPFTSASQEGSVIAMNKQLTKQAVQSFGINVVPGVNVFSREVKSDSSSITKNILNALQLPVIIKPVHLGSSIGITIAKTEVELEKFLLEASYTDSEILIEKLLTDFVEYNCAVRLIDGRVETSEIERPVSKDEILSFADKYQRGGKKSGGDGMASLSRELPAKISQELKNEIQSTAAKAFAAARCKGMVRIDFMHTSDGELFLTEINPIPGSMAFYLWEATGISFTQQITDLIEQAIVDFNSASALNLNYKTDIVEKFVNQ